MNTPLETLLEQADAAVARGSSDAALRIILDILHQIASGTLTISDTDLSDDVAYFEKKARTALAAGDASGAEKAENQANLLTSAETLVAEAEGKPVKSTRRTRTK